MCTRKKEISQEISPSITTDTLGVQTVSSVSSDTATHDTSNRLGLGLGLLDRGPFDVELAVASARELALVAGFKMLSAANAAKANARSRKELVLATEQPVERGGIYLI